MFFAQVAPDYSKELDDMVKAMNHPTTPTWIVSLVSAFLGFVASLLVTLFTDFRRKHTMRRVLYLELVGMYRTVNTVMVITALSAYANVNKDDGRRLELNERLRFPGEKYCRNNPELYMQLSEQAAADWVYPYFHRILDDEKGFELNTSMALSIFAHIVHDKSLKPFYLWLFLDRKQARELRSWAAARRHEEEQAERKSLDQMKRREPIEPE